MLATFVSNLRSPATLAAYQQGRTLPCRGILLRKAIVRHVHERRQILAFTRYSRRPFISFLIRGKCRDGRYTPDVETSLAVGHPDTLSNKSTLIGLVYVNRGNIVFSTIPTVH